MLKDSRVVVNYEHYITILLPLPLVPHLAAVGDEGDPAMLQRAEVHFPKLFDGGKE